MEEHFNLQWILGSKARDAFLTRNFGQRPLLIKRQNIDYYQQLLVLSQLEKMLFQAQALSPVNVRLVSSKGKVNPSLYVKSQKAGPAYLNVGIDLNKIVSLFKEQQATVVIENIIDSCDTLLWLCKALNEELKCAVGANAYITPAHSQGFKAHFDIHDVFVLQIYGVKRWIVYDNPDPVELPIGTQRGKPFDKAKLVPVIDELIEAGDLIYIPRGVIHEAMTSDQLSAHVSVGAYTTSWTRGLIDSLKKMVADEPVFAKGALLNLYKSEAEQLKDLHKISSIIHEKLTIRYLEQIFEETLDQNMHRSFQTDTSDSIFK
ncbi:cupin domain-containing protein [Pedobacter sp. AW31-3R]|uniref:cupin domain-containing protein n=1 Tax=Pedobacter sp. AW31-3R TaxID=3445781 RepID=UPI003FA114E4